MNKTYTLGEILRLGLLKNSRGEPYKDKAAISRLLRGLPRVPTPHGLGYAVTKKDIDRLNKRWG